MNKAEGRRQGRLRKCRSIKDLPRQRGGGTLPAGAGFLFRGGSDGGDIEGGVL